MDVLVCPVCASAKVGHDALIVGRDSDATCSNCGWRGKHRELIEAGIRERRIMENILSTGDSSLATKIAVEVSTTYLMLLAKYAGRPMGLALMESGVVGAKDPTSLARLIKAACNGAHKATLDEIEKMQEETKDAKRLTLS